MAVYDIGLSASNANATPQNTSAATVFNFNSAGTSFDGGVTSSEGSATAVATSKSPGAVTDVAANPNARNPATGALQFVADNPAIAYGFMGIVLVAVGVFAYIKLSKP